MSIAVCESCKSELAEGSTFCGRCRSQVSTRYYDAPIIDAQDFVPDDHKEWDQAQQEIVQYPTVPLQTVEEEQDHDRLLPLVVGFDAAADLRFSGQVPMAQGTPQIGMVPSAQGTPQMPGNVMHQAHMLNSHRQPPHNRNFPSRPSTLARTLYEPAHHKRANRIVAVAVAAVVVLGVVGALLIPSWLGGHGSPSASTPTPVLPVQSAALTSSGIAVPGGSITLHGQHFPPGGVVSFTIDGAPLAYTGHVISSSYKTSLKGKSGLSTGLVPFADTVTVVQDDGTFDKTLPIPQSWIPGSHHTIQASVQNTTSTAEATVNLGILHPGETPTATTSATATPTATGVVPVTPTASGATPTAGVTPTPTTPGVTPTPTTPGVTPTPTPVACISTSTQSLTFSGVAGKSDPAGSQTVTLNNCGDTGDWTGTIATNDGASWLSASVTSGSLTVGASKDIAVMASNVSSKLTVGTYTGHITFTLGSSAVSVSITLVVQNPPCITANTTSLTLTYYIGSSNALGRVLLTNCGDAGTLSASVSTVDGANWLSTNLTNGSSINSQGRQVVAISAGGNLNSGTYTGYALFTIRTSAGTASITVTVTLSVQYLIS